MSKRSVFRIIDANFNRAREAIRVIEEFCRFSLNSSQLTERAKQLRHELSTAVSKLDTDSMITCRDTIGDVGIGRTVKDQLQRKNLKDSFTAGCKRLTEALRVLAEMVQTLDSSQAEIIENLRYTAYTLEKDIVLFSDPAEKFRKVKLYVIISSQLPAEVIGLTHQCIDGGADCIQLRAKNTEDDKLFCLANEFAQICKDSGVLGVINDRVDVGVACGADGVHLGQNDLPIEQARKLQLTPLIIGKSTHSVKQLKQACIQLPTYVGLGPVFPTGTKPDAEPVGVEYVEKATEILSETGIGHAAIGGITLENVEHVLRAGAKTIAVCSAVTEAENPKKACQALKQKITNSCK